MTSKRLTEFTAAACRLLQDKMTEELQALAEEQGLTIRAAGGSFSASGWTAKFEVAIASADGMPTGREADAFRSLAHMLGVGLEPTDLGRSFKVREGEVRVVGLKTRTGKIIGERGGRLYLYDALVVAKLLEKKPEDSLKGITMRRAKPGEVFVAASKKGVQS